MRRYFKSLVQPNTFSVLRKNDVYFSSKNKGFIKRFILGFVTFFDQLIQINLTNIEILFNQIVGLKTFILFSKNISFTNCVFLFFVGEVSTDMFRTYCYAIIDYRIAYRFPHFSIRTKSTKVVTRTAEDTHYCMAPDPTFKFCKGQCLPCS